jgi:SAM-dependent methyltransferase
MLSNTQLNSEKTGRDLRWDTFLAPDFNFAEAMPGGVVVDVGCGYCRQLESLRVQGAIAIGVEPDLQLVERASSMGLDVRPGTAEALPLPDALADRVICKVVLPYTDEARAIREIGRVLRHDGTLVASYHGVGYFLRYLLQGPSFKQRFYGARTIVNTWWYVLTHHRLPGFIGDSLYQSERRLQSYYQRNELTLEYRLHGHTYLGFPVFIYHRAIKRGDRIVR